MNRKGPWEGYRRQAPSGILVPSPSFLGHVVGRLQIKPSGSGDENVKQVPTVSFPPSFARTFSSRERRLGTRQSLTNDT